MESMLFTVFNARLETSAKACLDTLHLAQKDD